MTRTTTIRMLDRVDQLRIEEIEPRETLLAEIREKADEYNSVWDIPDELDARYRTLKEEVKTLRGEADTLEHYAAEWGDEAFEIRELSMGGVGMVQDDVAEKSGVDLQGNGTPKSGYARTRTLEVAIKDKPDGAPPIDDIPDVVADWLFDAVDEYNTTGEVELGNSSLRMEMMRSES